MAREARQRVPSCARRFCNGILQHAGESSIVFDDEVRIKALQRIVCVYLKSTLRSLPPSIYHPALSAYRRVRRAIEHVRWELHGMPNPPSHYYKISTLRSIAAECGVGVFVETGTLHGDTTEALSSEFQRCVTIELDRQLFERAVSRFADNPRIEVIHGDSAAVIPRILGDLQEPALFWLDGHYSGEGTGKGDVDTPIRTELDAILAVRDQRHVIAIDDARLFDGTNSYPTLDELHAIVRRSRPTDRIELGHDIIRILPAGRRRGVA